MLYTLHAVQLALIQRLKKGGGGGGQHIEWPCSVRSFVCANNAWFSFRGGGGGGGVWGHAPPGKFRPYESASEAIETTISTQNLDCNSGNSLYCRFSEPLPFGISLCI